MRNRVKAYFGKRFEGAKTTRNVPFSLDDERELFERVEKGDKDAFNTLYLAYLPTIRMALEQFSGLVQAHVDMEDYESVLSQTLGKCINTYKGYLDPNSNFLRYLTNSYRRRIELVTEINNRKCRAKRKDLMNLHKIASDELDDDKHAITNPIAMRGYLEGQAVDRAAMFLDKLRGLITDEAYTFLKIKSERKNMSAKEVADRLGYPEYYVSETITHCRQYFNKIVTLSNRVRMQTLSGMTWQEIARDNDIPANSEANVNYYLEMYNYLYNDGPKPKHNGHVMSPLCRIFPQKKKEDEGK